jgi:hypothetical protein
MAKIVGRKGLSLDRTGSVFVDDGSGDGIEGGPRRVGAAAQQHEPNQGRKGGAHGKNRQVMKTAKPDSDDGLTQRQLANLADQRHSGRN